MNALPNWLPTFASNLLLSASDGRVWLSITAALLVGGVSLGFGLWLTRHLGLLDREASAGEAIGVGLGSGLLVLTSVWAAIGSGGRSAFVPVAVAFAAAIVLGRWRRLRAASPQPSNVPADTSDQTPTIPRMALAPAILCSAVFIVSIGLVYGATMAPSPRDGRQPVEFLDAAYYSILGRDLAQTGNESIYSPSGFEELPGLPQQTWYHWGDIWLSAIAITLFGLDPIFARHYVALPLILLAAAALTGTLVRRITGTTSRAAFLFGASASVFLAPIPQRGTFFAFWARGLIFGISMYGLAVSGVLLALFILVRREQRAPPTSAASLFAAGVVGSLVPSHILIALLAFAGVGSVLILQLAAGLAFKRRLPAFPRPARATVAASCLVVAATAAWGAATGHGIGASGQSPNVPAFNNDWRESVALTALGFGPFLAAPLVWAYRRKASTDLGWMIVGVLCLLVAGSLAWGARLGDFTMFHVFYGGIAVFATPIAAIAIWAIWVELRARGYVRLGIVVLALSWAQIAIGIVPGIQRLQQFGPYAYDPIPIALLDAIRQLPAGAKLAYACSPMEELGAFWDPRLASIDAHTGHRVVPMCFQAEVFGALNGEHISPDVISPLFRLAPQRAIYPDSEARPSPEAIAGFLRANGIGYIYADTPHPNSMVRATVSIASSGGMQVLRIP